MLATSLFLFVQTFFGLLEWAIFIHVLYSWLRPHASSWFYRLISSIVLPIYAVFRRIIPSFGPVDLTPLFCLIGIEIMGYLLLQLIAQIPT